VGNSFEDEKAARAAAKPADAGNAGSSAT